MEIQLLGIESKIFVHKKRFEPIDSKLRKWHNFREYPLGLKLDQGT